MEFWLHTSLGIEEWMNYSAELFGNLLKKERGKSMLNLGNNSRMAPSAPIKKQRGRACI